MRLRFSISSDLRLLVGAWKGALSDPDALARLLDSAGLADGVSQGLALHFVPAQWFTIRGGRLLVRLVKAWAVSHWQLVGSRARLLVTWACMGGACFKTQERSGGAKDRG